jgi:ABC-type multidrug transport system ATPase subunit
MIGYCPQENPLFDFMKVREIVAFYLNLKGSSETIESICSTFDLSKYLDTYCVNLSGGNKRKLTFAIALMNKPNLLLLDEPSTGVDPESRRIMWKNINQLSNTGHQYNMILTTHSIEEAEVLCDRVSWLKKGNFVCLGNPEQLKLHYSNGYKLQIKFVDNVLNRNDVSTLTRKIVQDAFIEINNLVQGFNNYSKYITTNPLIILYIKVLIEVAKEIKPNTNMLKLLSIEKDFSFIIQVGVLKEKQNILFSQIFNLKTKIPKIAEISINLESLGNILTYFR